MKCTAVAYKKRRVKIIDAVLGGMTTPATAERFGVSHQYVSHIMREAGYARVWKQVKNPVAQALNQIGSEARK